MPLAIQMGVGPVQFGMMLLLNCALGLVHPPVGTVQFIGCAIGKISIGEATKTAWPYYLAIFIAITLVTYVPIVLDLAAIADHRPRGPVADVCRLCLERRKRRHLGPSSRTRLRAHADAGADGRRRRRSDAAALSPKRDRLYAARRSEPRAALSFAIAPVSGKLSALGAGPLPHSMAYLSTDATGRYLFSASYGGNLIAVNAIDGNGVVQATQQVVPTAPNAHAILAAPSNHFVFSTSLGGGIMNQFRFDAATGQLTPNAAPTITPHEGASPRHFVFSPDSRFVYLLNELDATIDVLAQ